MYNENKNDDVPGKAANGKKTMSDVHFVSEQNSWRLYLKETNGTCLDLKKLPK